MRRHVTIATSSSSSAWLASAFRVATPAETAAELARLEPARLVVAGGSSVVSESVKAVLGGI